MEEVNLVVHEPEDGVSLSEYLQGFSDDEIQQIFRHPDRLREFCRILQENFREFQNAEDDLERLWDIIRRVNDVDHLLYCIGRLEPVRHELLELLQSKEVELKQISKLCTTGRLIGSFVDLAGTIGGLRMRESNPGCADLAFKAATCFGPLGILITASELNILKNSLEEMMRMIQRDQELMAPIQHWYHQTNELEEAILNIFPFDVTNQMVDRFANLGNSELTPVNLLAALLSSIAEEDFSRVRDETLIRKLISFTFYPASLDWIKWIICRRHPVILDIARIALQQQHSPSRFALCQSIPALAIGDQNIWSIPVWGRMSLNLMSIVYAINSLRRSEAPPVSNEIGHLRNHLRSELTSLQRIVEFIRIRRANQRRERNEQLKLNCCMQSH